MRRLIRYAWELFDDELIAILKFLRLFPLADVDVDDSILYQVSLSNTKVDDVVLTNSLLDQVNLLNNALYQTTVSDVRIGDVSISDASRTTE